MLHIQIFFHETMKEDAKLIHYRSFILNKTLKYRKAKKKKKQQEFLNKRWFAATSKDLWYKS